MCRVAFEITVGCDGASCRALTSVDGVTNGGLLWENCCTSLNVHGNAPGATRYGEPVDLPSELRASHRIANEPLDC